MDKGAYTYFIEYDDNGNIKGLNYKTYYTGRQIHALAYIDKVEVGNLTVDCKERGDTIPVIDEDNNSMVPNLIWRNLGFVELIISSWFVDGGAQKLGIGKELLRQIFNKIEPLSIVSIKYIWNGTNEYVGKWLEKFDAVNECPIAFLKNSEKDSWECHLYALNVEKFLKY